MKRTVLFAGVFALACAGLLRSAPSAAQEGLGGPLVLPDAVGLSQTVSWGYGCGGHCAFQFGGESAVRIEFRPKNLVRVTDAGKLTRRENHPDGSATEERVFSFSFKGGWFNAAGAREITLVEDRHTCKVTRTAGNQSETSDGPLPAKKLSLRCAKTTVTAASTAGPIEVEALSCQPLNLDDYPGTEWPWVFGLSRRLRTVRSGEPRPKVEYRVD